MKIKGAFPVRWAAQNGADGTGVTVASQQVKYASSTQGTDHPTTGWQTSIPNVAEGNFLWTWLHLVFSDGKYTDIYSSARQGIDGRGIQSSSVTYSQQATSVNPETITDWGGFPSELIDGYWLYTRTVITYSDGAPSTSYSVSQIGTGSYYAGTAEYFAAGVSPDTPPEGYAPMGTYVSGETIQTTWKQERPPLTAETPYLWNFEISSDSRGNRYVTNVICIGNFAKGITSIVETYAISAYGSVKDGRDYPEDIVEKDWTDEHFAAPPTNEKPYQWNKTTTTYNDGSIQNNYHISAVKGIDGKGAIYIDLDNENDSMLYDGSGNLISGDMVSNIKLYDNGSDKTLGRAFSIDSSSGVVASISNATFTLTVTSMSANSGYVIVKCIYNGVPYYARFTCKKIIGTDKYELVCTPSALTFNDDTDTGGQVTVTIQVYKTAQNGTRSLLQSLPTGYSLIRKWQDTQTIETAKRMEYSNYKATFKPYDAIYDRYRIELLDASQNVLDYETIPINHVRNGEQGASAFVLDAENENIGFVVENNGRWSESQSRTIKINAYYGAAKVTSGVTYSIDTEGNTDASGRNYLSVSGVKDGEITIGTQDNIVWTKDKVVNVKITATHATYGTRSIIISCVPVFGGADGLPATLYELQPSLDVLSFARNEKGGYSPASLQVYCGYIKIVGDSRTSFEGNIKKNLWNIDGKYNIMGRYHKADDSFTGWTLAEKLPNGTFTVQGDSDYTAIEFIFTSATEVSQVSDSNIFDREIVPVMRDGANGETTFYYAVPSADKITRKHEGTLSPATINCKSYKKTGTDDPELVTSGAQGSYDYYVGTAKYTVDNYTGGDITPTPWWTKIVFYLKSSDGVVLTQREILVENEDISPEQNLLNDTNFTNLLLDSSTNRYKSEILEGEGVDGNNALLCNPDSLEKDAEPYNGVWTQAVSQPNDKRLLPGTWYTFSFWAKTLGYSQIDIKQSSNLYGFATKSVYLTVAEHRLRIRGNASTLALSANRWLRVFVLKDDWSWSRYVDIKQSAITEAEVSFTPPSEGTYKIRAYCYSDNGGNATAEQTVYLEWYRLKLANRQNKLVSYCHPNVIDTQQVQVHDGNVIDFRPSDGYNLVTLTQSWKRFYMVFKTKSTIPTDRNYVLFRIPKDGNSVYLSQIKLERGVFPTAWTGSNHDTKGYNGAKPDFQKFSQMQDVSKQVYQGVGEEEWYTIVYDDVNHTGWYTPVYSHLTSKGEVLTDTTKWRMSNMQFVATSVFFAQMAYIENLGVRNVLLSDGSTIEGGMCYSDKDENGNSLNLGNVRFWLGSSSPSSGTIRGYKDGTFVAANGKAQFYPSGKVTLCDGNATFDENGNTTIANLNATSSKFTGEVNATSGKFTDVEVNGSMRSTFTAPSGISDVDVSDCISLISTGVGTVADKYNLPWNAKQSGRRISIVNWKWNGQTSTGFASIKAPTGKYFFEDGIQKSELKLSRQAVELLGYGTSDEFYGWIVLRRENIMTAYQYGKCQRVLFWGSVRCSSSTSYSLTQAWYDGTNDKARLERKEEGLYRISFPDGIIADASHLLVMVTGIGYIAGSSTLPCKATVVAKRSNGFDVAVSDDETKNDGSFDFFVANIMDWL